MNMPQCEREKEIYRITLLGSVGNLLLLIFKFVAGIVGHSAAMIADAVHSLSDFATDIIVLLFVRISNKPQDKGHDFGHGKYETLATAIIGVILFFVGLGILWNGIVAIKDYLQGSQLEEPGTLALCAAVVSIVVKEALYQCTAFVGHKVDSQVVVANAWHHRSDALSSIGAMVGIGGAIVLGEDWRVLDPVAAVVVSVFIMFTACKLVGPCVDELTERSLPEDVERAIEQALTDIPGVVDPHNMRTRKIGHRSAVNVHVRMDGEMTVNQSHAVTRTMEKRIRQILGADSFVSIHVEPIKSACSPSDYNS